MNAFWSITLYDNDGFPVGNVRNRFAVSSYMPFTINGDGSLELYFQNESPGKDKEANWLPAPKGPLNLCMRLYAPKSEAPYRQVESAGGHENPDVVPDQRAMTCRTLRPAREQECVPVHFSCWWTSFTIVSSTAGDHSAGSP